MIGPFILIIWTTYGGVKVPASAQFSDQQACESALNKLKEKGFKDGMCLSYMEGK